MRDEYWNANPYYSPEKCGLKIVHSYDRTNQSYEFDLVVLWMDLETGKYYVGEDSGCSCPIPFEDFHCLADMKEVDVHTAKRVFEENY